MNLWTRIFWIERLLSPLLVGQSSRTMYNFIYGWFISVWRQRRMKRTICWKGDDRRGARDVMAMKEMLFYPGTEDKDFWRGFIIESHYDSLQRCSYHSFEMTLINLSLVFCILGLIYNWVNLNYVTLASEWWLDFWLLYW